MNSAKVVLARVSAYRIDAGKVRVDVMRDSRLAYYLSQLRAAMNHGYVAVCIGLDLAELLR